MLKVNFGRAPRIAVAAAVLLSAEVNARTFELDPVVVTASRFEQKLSDTLPHTTVFTQADIERSQVTDVLSLIARAAGVEVAPLGSVGAQSGLFVRGSESRHVLVLVDGVPLNNLNFSLASLDQLTVGQIDRIEIVRGNVSSLYGSQAVGGVVQVFTRGAQRTESGVSALARAALGSRGTQEQGAAVEGAAGVWRYAVSASHYATDGASAIDASKRTSANPDRDGYRNRSAHALIGLQWAEGHEVSLRGLSTRGRLQYDSEFGPATQADESEQHIETLSLAVRDQFTPIWRSTLTASHLRDTLDARVTAFPYFVTSEGTQWAWQHDVTVAEHWTATAAFEQLDQRIKSDTTYGRNDRKVDAVRLGLAGHVGAHRAQVNVRHDDYSDFGQADTGYLGYGYALSDALRVFASTSTAFNAPTFNDLFYPFGGNTALKPEKARSREWGVQYATPKLRLRSAVFATRYSDLIGNDASFNRANMGRASVEGVELSAETFVRTVRVVLSVTAQDARNDSSDTRLIRRARNFGNVQLSRALGSVDGELNWRLTGNRTDSVSGQARTLGGYGVLDLSVRWHAHEHCNLTARATNVFDQHYENAWGYPGAARAVLVGVEARL